MTPRERWLYALTGDPDAIRQVMARMDRQARCLGLHVKHPYGTDEDS